MGEAAENGAVFKDKSYCKVHPGCDHWHNGMGSDVCFKCKKLEAAVNIDPIKPSFLMSAEMEENCSADPNIRSLLEGMRGLPWKDKIIFIEFVLDRPPGDIAAEYEVSRATVYATAKRVRKHIKDALGIDT